MVTDYGAFIKIPQSSCHTEKPSEIADVGDKVWDILNQGTRKNLSPNNSFQDYTGQITLKALLNTTCKKEEEAKSAEFEKLDPMRDSRKRKKEKKKKKHRKRKARHTSKESKAAKEGVEEKKRGRRGGGAGGAQEVRVRVEGVVERS
ncbi:unnamed protein product [Nyctereutes procyonoides]|uniref:(raccoon dog) hypothetical protein n=1 Tax=Nyctereutes procyonoides TaxID=34880 RepID=A0A811ZTP7_NYCPR|nr:unnamed protein product [Nyctereutes procyonoides]